MTDELSILDGLEPDWDHVTTESLFASHGWTRCGVGDWAVALRSPSGDLAARISPFDPVATYTVRLFRQAAATGQVPVLHAHRDLEGGAVLTVMEHLLPADPLRLTAHRRVLVARTIPTDRRRHMFDLPLAESGPWDPVGREGMRAVLAAADAPLS